VGCFETNFDAPLAFGTAETDEHRDPGPAGEPRRAYPGSAPVFNRLWVSRALGNQGKQGLGRPTTQSRLKIGARKPEIVRDFCSGRGIIKGRPAESESDEFNP